MPSPVPWFYFHPEVENYSFGTNHPLKPERLRRMKAYLEALIPDIEYIVPPLATEYDLARVHSEWFIHIVDRLSQGKDVSAEDVWRAGFSKGDNPAFPGMMIPSLAYCGGAVQAAQRVNEGAPLAFSIAGGLHHAQREKASGFCIFNDPAIACSILREKFDKVLYVDIDLHHGDGVQAIFYDDPQVVTLSIHESGRTLYPGTGFLSETGIDDSSINIPLRAGTTGLVWLEAFREVFEMTVNHHRPNAIVLQMGCDPQITDPLGHLQVRTQDWLEAVKTVQATGLPIVAVGGGGYDLRNVPRMWSAAILTLSGIDFPNEVPETIPEAWGMKTMFDDVEQARIGQEDADDAIEFWARRFKS